MALIKAWPPSWYPTASFSCRRGAFRFTQAVVTSAETLPPMKRITHRNGLTVTFGKQKTHQVKQADPPLGRDSRVGSVAPSRQCLLVRLVVSSLLSLVLPARITVMMAVWTTQIRLVAVPELHHLGPVLTRQVLPHLHIAGLRHLGTTGPASDLCPSRGPGPGLGREIHSRPRHGIVPAGSTIPPLIRRKRHPPGHLRPPPRPRAAG